MFDSIIKILEKTVENSLRETLATVLVLAGLVFIANEGDKKNS
ncbi:hypothetical protein [Conservatibacter flavescens]|nr:hypothetical protein [Conservatibacter flavescens]